MDLYVIAPVEDLELMNEGDRIFALAHLWVKFPKYREFILNKKKEGWFITLDNSAAERSLVTEDVLIEICHELMPNEVISPDVLFDCQKTIENLIMFKQRMRREGLIDKIDIFGCPQGASFDEWITCYKFMLKDEDVKVIGLSKIATPRVFLGPNIGTDQGIKEARHMAYNFLKMNNLLQKPIHCLGQGDPTEFSYYNHPMMRSTDSVYPVLAGDLGIGFGRGEFERIPTPHDYLEIKQIDKDRYPFIKENISFLKILLLKR